MLSFSIYPFFKAMRNEIHLISILYNNGKTPVIDKKLQNETFINLKQY